MTSRQKIAIALTLAGLATWWRVSDMIAVGGWGELHGEEGKNFLHGALENSFFSNLVRPDAGYLVIPLRLMAWFLVKVLGLVEYFPHAFKTVTVFVQSLCYTLVLSKHFAVFGPLPVRALFALTLLIGPWCETYLPFNTPYAYVFILLYALWAVPRHPIVLMAVFLATFGKPVMVVLAPLFLLRAHQARREKDRAALTACLVVLTGFVVQAVYVASSGRNAPAAPLTALANGLITLWLTNFATAASFSAAQLLAFPEPIFSVPRVTLVTLSYVAGLSLIVAWSATLIHARRRQDHDSVSALLLPLVALPGAIAFLTWGYASRRTGAFDLAFFTLDKDPAQQATRYTLFLGILSLSGVLTLLTYWGRRWPTWPRLAVPVMVALLVGLSTGRWHTSLPYARDEWPSDWKLYRPLVKRDAYCVPISGFPDFFLKEKCERLATETLSGPNPTFQLTPTAKKSRWRVQGLVVEWRADAPGRAGLKLVVSDQWGREHSLTPRTSPTSRYQYFDLEWRRLGYRKLRLEIAGAPVSAPRTLAVHYLGSPH